GRCVDRRRESRRLRAAPRGGARSPCRPGGRARATGGGVGGGGLRRALRRRHAARADPWPQARCARERCRLCARGHRGSERGAGVGWARRARAARHGPIDDRIADEAASRRMKLLVGTRSPGKTREIRQLFAGLPFELTFPTDRLLEPLPEEADLERGMSYVENAVAKARYYAMRGGLPAVADDSGIE